MFPGVYQAKATRITATAVLALVPQIFGEAPVTITRFMGQRPSATGTGWVTFVGGNPEFPVWVSGVILGGEGGLGPVGPPGPPGPPGTMVVQFGYAWSNNTTASDPGSGKVKADTSDISAVTTLYVSIYDRAGQAHPALLNLVADDFVLLYESGDLSQSVRYKVTGTVIGTADWVTIPVVADTVNLFDPNNNDDVEIFLPANISGGGGEGTDEVWVGTDDPIGTTPTIELWYDTDDEPVAVDNANFWNSSWGRVGQSNVKAVTLPANAPQLACTDPLTVTLRSGRRYRIKVVFRAMACGNKNGSAAFGLYDGGVATNLFDGWISVANNYGGGTVENFYDGDGITHVYDVRGNGQSVDTTSPMQISAGAGSIFYVEDVGPVTKAAVNPPAGQPTIATAGNALGIVAMAPPLGNTYITAGPSPVPTGGVACTAPVTFTFQVGRRYRISMGIAGSNLISGSATGINFMILDSANAGVGDGDIWLMVPASNYQGGFLVTNLNGDGTTKTIRAVVYVISGTGNTVGSYVKSLYIEDVGPNSAPALPIPETPPGWTPVTTFLNGWSNYGGSWPVAAYRKIGDEVQMRGLIKGGTFPTVGLNLPVGFRPLGGIGGSGAGHHFTVDSVGAFGEVRITADGDVRMGTGNVSWVDLIQIRFSVTP